MAFIKKAALITVGQIAGHVLTLLAGIILARTMGPAGVGQLEVFRSFQSVIVTLFALGIGNASIYFINNVGIRSSELLATTLRATVLISILLLLAVSFIVWLSPHYFGSVSTMVIIVYALGTSFSLVILSCKTVLTAQLYAGQMVLVDQLPKLIIVICFAGGLLAGTISVSFGLYVLTFGNLASMLVLFFLLRNHFNFDYKFSGGLFKKILLYGIKLSACDILFILNANISVIMLKYLDGNNFAQIGIYSRAVAISSMVSLIPYTIGPLLYAKLSSRPGHHLIGSTQYALRLTLSLSIVMCFFVYLLRSPIILILYGKQFLEAEKVVRVLAASLVFFCISNVCLNFLAGQGRAALNVKILFFTLLAIVITTYIGIRQGGIEGAAYGILIGNIVTAFSGLYFCQKIFGLRVSESLILRGKDLNSLIRSMGWQKQNVQTEMN